MGWVRPDLGIQIATFLLLFSPVTFVLQYGGVHGADCDERGFAGRTSVHMVMVYGLHAMQEIWAPLDQARTGKAGARLLGKQTKTHSETANQGSEKSRESVGRSPPISALIFVYASVEKTVWISWSRVLVADNYDKASLVSTSRPAENHCQPSNSNCLTIQLFCVSNYLQTGRSAE